MKIEVGTCDDCRVWPLPVKPVTDPTGMIWLMCTDCKEAIEGVSKCR